MPTPGTKPTTARRLFTWHDAVKIGVSAGGTVALTWATTQWTTQNAFLKSGGLVIAGLVLGVLILITVDRFRAYSEEMLKRTHDELQDDLRSHLDTVHSSVRFIAESGDQADGRPSRGYDAATAAVKRAEHRILIIGDYNPPAHAGPRLDRPPAHRNEYLAAIEDMLEQRLRDYDPRQAPFTYHRFIQRPTDIYEQIGVRARDQRVSLTAEDMVGDEQAFWHCKRVLEIAHRANKHLDIEIRLIPFLPNCPSILLVDQRDIQFTIPTRIDELGGADTAPIQGLHGVLAMQDRKGGTQLCKPFEDLFHKLGTVSMKVIRVDDDANAGRPIAPRQAV
jgi:hypothetical protein